MRHVAAGDQKQEDDRTRQEQQRLTKWKVVLGAAEANARLERPVVRIDAPRTFENGGQLLARRFRRCAWRQAHGDCSHTFPVNEREPDVGSFESEVWKDE